QSIMDVGVLEPVLVRKNGLDADGQPILELEDGRRRTLHAIEANRRLTKLGRPPVLIPFLVRNDDDQGALKVQHVANAHREDDLPMVRARKMDRALNRDGLSLAQVALQFNCSPQTVKNTLELLRLHPTLQAMV